MNLGERPHKFTKMLNCLKIELSCSSLVYSVLYVNYDNAPAPIRSNKIFSRENTSQPITQNDHFKKFVCRKHTDMNLLFNMEYGKNHNEVALKIFFIIMFSQPRKILMCQDVSFYSRCVMIAWVIKWSIYMTNLMNILDFT